MPQFSYKARKRSGELVEGVLDVADRGAALMQIQRLGLFSIAVDTARAGAVADGKPASKGVDLASFLPPTLRAQLSQKRKPKLQELATFTTQLANLLNSGMPLTVALNSMTHLQTKGERKAFLFTNVTDGRGRKYAFPVVVGALAANRAIYSIGMRAAVDEIPAKWDRAIAHPIPPRIVEHAVCQEVVIEGAALQGEGNGLDRLPIPISTTGFDSAPTLDRKS